MNAYGITTAQLFMLYDERTMKQLSGDQNTSQGNPSNAQFVIDLQAGELDSVLYGRYPLPIPTPVPMVLVKWVLITAAERMWGRRNDKPKQLEADAKWAESWLKMLMDQLVSIPGLQAQIPVLQDSNFPAGQSQFDRVYGQPVSPYGPTNTTGNVAQP